MPFEGQHLMLSIELAADVEELLALFVRADALNASLRAFTSAEGALDKAIERIAQGGKEVGLGANEASAALTAVKGVLASIQSRAALFRSLDVVAEGVEAFIDRGRKNRIELDGLKERLGQFRDAFDRYLAEPNARRALPLLRESRRLYRSLDTTQLVLGMVAAQLRYDRSLLGEEEHFTIKFGGSATVAELVEKLQAVQDLFSAANGLLGNPGVDPQVRVLKIESGSLFLDGAAWGPIVKLCQAWISEAARFVYRNHTDAGALERNSEVFRDAFKRLVEARQLATKIGLDTAPADTELERFLNAGVKSARILVERQVLKQEALEESRRPDRLTDS